MHYVPANSASAFEVFATACRANDIGNECCTALAIALMLPDCAEIDLPLSEAPPKEAKPTDNPKDCYWILYQHLNNCITLSCLDGGIESLLCCQFFDASVPCNLVGAYLLGISRAIDSMKSDAGVFTALMGERQPMLSLLWQAAFRTGRSESLTKTMMKGLPNINLAVASWTDTLQSFMQVEYAFDSYQYNSIPRALEFSLAYMVSPNIVKPFTPSPPFGQTVLANSNLDVREHLHHFHRPRLCRTYWLLANGEEILAHEHISPVHRPSIHLPNTAQTTSTETVDME